MSNVGIEPPLQPLTGKHLTLKSANREDGARLDIAADNFWGREQNCAFFDVRVFRLFMQSHQNTSLSQHYKKNEQEKKEHMANVSDKWSMGFFQHQEEWDQQPTWSTKE